jgi:hypothetical protein
MTTEKRPTKLSTSKDIRLYDEDAEEIRKLHEDVYRDTNLSQVDIVRDCVHAGLPLIVQRLRPLVKR